MPPIKRRNNKEKLPIDTDKVVEYYRSIGFDSIDTPLDKRPVMPANMAGLTQVGLSDTLSAYTAWREYTRDLISVANAERVRLQEEYDYEYSKLYVSLSGNATERKHHCSADERLKTHADKLTTATMYAEMLESKIESFTECISTLSREITLRTNHG